MTEHHIPDAQGNVYVVVETLKDHQDRLHAAQDVVAERRQELQAAVLAAREHRSLADIARELGVSKQRVDQISRGK